MKLRSSRLIFIAALSLVAFLKASTPVTLDRQAGKDNVAQPAVPVEDEIVRAVKGYWEAAFAGDEEGANKHLTKTPMSYIRNCKSTDPPEPDDTVLLQRLI